MMSWINHELEDVTDERLAGMLTKKQVVILGASTRVIAYITKYLDKNNCIVIDSNPLMEGKVFEGFIVHSINYFSELDSAEVVAISVIKNYSYIMQLMKEIQIKEFYIQKYNSLNKYKSEFLKNDELIRKNKEILHTGNFDFVDFIYDGKFVVNVIEAIIRESDISKHLIIIHYLNELNPDDLYNVWELYEQNQNKYNNVIILNDMYHSFDLDDNAKYHLITTLKNSKRIIFHSGVISIRLGDFLSEFINEFREKTYLIIHGGELLWKTSSNEYHKFFSKIGNVVLNNQKYFTILNSLYNFNEGVNVITNSSLAYDSGIIVMPNEKSNKTLNVLVGYSAAKDIDHKLAFELLEKFKDEDMNVICPLSYMGDETYINEVIAKGRDIFGEKLKVIREFLTLEDYSRLLSEVDIGVFPLSRNCGWTTIFAMLKGGKKIYLTSVNSYREIFKYNITVFNVSDISVYDFQKFKENKVGGVNKEEIEKYLKDSKQNMFSWSKLYSTN
ncbi:TDP-N-acetylfucosamine:lipid II N-acetylfucosaminyltransferase [Anaerocolumna sp. AGMB13025]|uniref:TDP-N-acetylfucosamine:lipid II N-acetylfucosaminyltransferase n=1 Tax=Anaerocolumna sp. AGMB13025 TaxID=3039116 RepID=UPI00241F065C|nr:TDP-N-acetylfucosamine:lipid II N-acetylfucosaminyltransferase [Anaerocolumna sp. AGMB13025]WFR56790.1 TDP-N-acetylfucosamine:lipid II N-acetylfucosaminyltransferase [Anaerocolumna sp. AGMB13025]